MMQTLTNSSKFWRLVTIFLFGGLLTLLLFWRVDAGSMPASSVSAPIVQQGEDLACRQCHQDSEAVIEFPSGETMSAQINLDSLAHSVHGSGDEPLACTSCHAPTNYQIPHAGISAPDIRSYQIEQANSCQKCHNDSHPTSHPTAGSENPVVCTDCHNAHEVQEVTLWSGTVGVVNCLKCHEAGESNHLNGVIQAGLFVNGEPQETCLACHGQPDIIMQFSNGDELSLTIDPADLHGSVHGEGNDWQALTCQECHTEDYSYPHQPVVADSAREYHLQKYPSCGRCHEDQYNLSLDSVHGMALTDDKEEAAVCTDCHGAHDTPVPNEPRARVSHTCEQCHSTIYEEYAGSIHGDALLTDGNEDVPTCIGCHGVHNIGDPTTNLFRIRSPQLCADCHADEELMAEYEISTDVFETYVTDFHGETVTLFEQQDPEVETNKAVCYDCHGVHNILAPDDPHAGIKANLLETCQQCHPDATANFSDAWTSHFQPSLEHNPLVYLVRLFYRIIIPVTVGGLLFLVSTDLYRRARIRFSGRSV